MEQNKMDELPEGWRTEKLWAVCDFLNGFAFQSSNYCDSGHRVIRIANVQKGRLVDTDPKFINENELKWLERFILNAADLLISLTWNVGRTGFVPREMLPAVLNQRVWKISPNKSDLRPDFTFHLFQSADFERDCISNSVGAAQKNMSLRWLEEYIIPLPPLSEQERIVTKLDGIFEHIDASIKLLEQNIADADAMAESVLNEIFIQGSISEWWDDFLLCGACQLDPKKSEIKETPDDTEVSFVPMSDIGQESEPFSPQQTRPLGSVRKGYTYFRDGDVLFAKVTPCFENWKGGIAEGLVNGIGFGSSEYYVLRPESGILAWYVYRFVSSQAFRREWATNMWGAVWLQRVKKEWLTGKEIPLPPLPEQERIVAKLDAFFAEQKAMKSGYETKISELKALKSSILSEAFQGKI